MKIDVAEKLRRCSEEVPSKRSGGRSGGLADWLVEGAPSWAQDLSICQAFGPKIFSFLKSYSIRRKILFHSVRF